MNFISASYNMYHNSIDITTFDGYILRLRCQKVLFVRPFVILHKFYEL